MSQVFVRKTRYFFRHFVTPLALALAFQLAGQVRPVAADQLAGAADPRDDKSPWGVGSGAEWFSAYPLFNPLLKTAGVQWLRGFYEWQTIQPKQGYWNWALSDHLVENARANQLHLTFAFAYFAPWASADGGTRKFPIRDIQFWRDYVAGVVGRYHGDIKYWEVWNEFNGSFAENGTPEMYAELVREASLSAKKIDPSAKIGMSVANFDVAFLDRAIKAGAANHFDYVCVHPYEKLERLDEGGEADFLGMVTKLRQMLASNNQPADMPLWITEIGAKAPLSSNPLADRRQAVLLSKAYLLSIASGFERVFWFEARGPSYGGDSDYGLLRANMTPRTSYRALKAITGMLGAEPANAGWLDFGDGHGFMFKNGDRNVLAVWASPHRTFPIKFEGQVQVGDLEGIQRPLAADETLSVSDVPLLVTDLPASLIEQALANKGKPFPWGGDYARARTVSVRLQSENADNGLSQVNSDTTIVVKANNESWRQTNFQKPGGEGHYAYFRVAPSFAPFGTKELEITATVRRVSSGQVTGMSLSYESDKGYVGAGYRNIPEGGGWHDLKWNVTDANFAGGWGWNFRFDGVASPSDFQIREVKVTKPDAR